MQVKHNLRNTLVLVAALFAAVPGFSQSKAAVQQAEATRLQDARDALARATNAGAATTAKSLYDEAQDKLQYAERNWNAPKSNAKNEARASADEAYYAARAAEAKARWMGTNMTIRDLQGDITRFGGRSDLTLSEEAAAMLIDRGADSRSRIVVAQAAIDQARAAGAATMANSDLNVAEDWLGSARKIAKTQKQSVTADHLSYEAEMIARRAFYLARFGEVNKYVANLQLQRTQLAQQYSQAQAQAEKRQREQAEQQAAALRQQLATEQADRQTQQAELDRLRTQIEANRLGMQQRLDSDRAARLEAEKTLDETIAHYESAIAAGSSSEVDALRRQMEDQQFALRSVQERERLGEQTMSTEIESLRADLNRSRQSGSLNAQVLTEREAELTKRQDELVKMRQDREAAEQRRADAEKAAQAAIAESQQRRQDAEMQAAKLKMQVEEQQAELEQAKQQGAATQAELQQARSEIAKRDIADSERVMRENLSRIVRKTRSTDRGLIVTLPGIFFDPGKTALKAGAKATLKRIAAELKKSTDLNVAVEGHTDSVGGTEKNLALSEKRAAAVKDYLISQGVAAEHINSVGKGEAEPVASNKTAAGRQQNRRVELVITR